MSAATNPVYGSDVVVDVLADLDVPYLACNPGATFRGLHDSVVNYAGERMEIIECLHEEISVAIAHGYYKATGTMMAAAVHDVVGLQHASMAIYNAWCDQVPVLVLGATGPMDATQRRPWIDWIHTALVQGTQVRDYTKWDDQPGSLAATPESLIRATHIATTAPRAPVYVCLDSVIQEQEVEDDFTAVDVSRFAAPSPVAPDGPTVERVASWLVEAERPAVLSDLGGRGQEALDLLVELAEDAALPVVDRERSYNKASLAFPTRHPLNLSGDPAGMLDDADLVLALEVRDLTASIGWSERPAYGGRGRAKGPSADARVVHVNTGSQLHGAWAADAQRLHAATLQLPVEPIEFLRAVLPRVRELLAESPVRRRQLAKRRERLAAASAAQFAAWEREAAEPFEGEGIGRANLARILDEVTGSCDRVLANGNLDNWVHRLWDLDRADQYLGDAGGAGLGYGLGATAGAALAHRDNDRLVIDIQSDGDALYTPGALWTMTHHRLPALIVMDNNRGYNNSIEHAERMAVARGRDVGNREVGCGIADPAIDHAGLARSFGMAAEGPIEHVDDLKPALERAMRIVCDERRPALVDVITGLTPIQSVRSLR
jgi:acetolactate synthase I/II/III large subunit